MLVFCSAASAALVTASSTDHCQQHCLLLTLLDGANGTDHCKWRWLLQAVSVITSVIGHCKQHWSLQMALVIANGAGSLQMALTVANGIGHCKHGWLLPLLPLALQKERGRAAPSRAQPRSNKPGRGEVLIYQHCSTT